ncbi:hypothetical protein FNU79_17555 [Deinococcus detaillensis]|uniref:Uncharacterized protein n=1 Tax=Deinococcus detaillensis TaxID=2592048 RepID=A0A553UHY2_9DEIO|nr:hypothetical protein [Deinococcus detaillensis]TSA79641.1 hypothetical protein FNU79_17555 [Deinococcus detaillensis]
MSQDFLTRFLAGQRAKGQDQTSAFAVLERVHGQSGRAAVPPQATPAWLIDALEHQERQQASQARQQAGQARAAITRRPTTDTPPPVVRLAALSSEAAVLSLTACLDSAPCREISRAIFRTLYAVALDVAASQGHAASVTQAVFHLPAELVMDYVERKSSAFYENLLYLRSVGLIHCEAHMGDLRGAKVATGTLWAVSLQPERILTGQAAPARIRREDWGRKWRDLNADAKAGETVYNLLNPRPAPTKEPAGQSREPERVKTTLDTLKRWAKKPFSLKESDTLTVRQAPGAALDVVWQLGEAAGKPRNQRAAVVDRQARALAAAFGDDQLGFWRRLIWNLTRGIDAGVNLADDAGAILARILTDVRHDLATGSTPPHTPAAVANAALEKLRAHLEMFKDLPVGVRPAAA